MPLGKRTYDSIIASAPRRENNGIALCLICIDVYSRYALWLQCRSKTTASGTAALQAVFDTMGEPKNLTTDFESAILSNDVQAWLVSKRIQAERKRNNAMVERNIRTMREMVAKGFASYGTRRWIGPLIEALNLNYNSLVLCATSMGGASERHTVMFLVPHRRILSPTPMNTSSGRGTGCVARVLQRGCGKVEGRRLWPVLIDARTVPRLTTRACCRHWQAV